MEWRVSESSSVEQPAAIDTTSSAVVVYARKNFEQVEKTNDDGSTYTVWQYLEQIIPKEDWEYYSSVIAIDSTVDNNRADIDYLLIVTDNEDDTEEEVSADA